MKITTMSLKKVIFLGLIATMLAWACGAPPARPVQQEEVHKSLVVSILPLKYLVENITNNDFAIEVLVPPGSSPETYEPTPTQMAAVEESELLFVTGLIDFEQQLSAKIDDQNADKKVVDLSEGIDLIEGSCSHQGHGHGVDPHIWSSPRNLKKMAETIYRKVALLYPDSLRYRDNFDRLTTYLDSLDEVLVEMVSNARSKTFIIYHPALTYLARDYGLTQVALEHEGKEPSAEKLKQIIEDARGRWAIRIFYQKQFSPATMETMAREMGAECIEIDPLREDVGENLLYMTGLICL